MKFLRFLWLPLLVLLWSCHDEEPALPSDSYEGAYSSFTLGDEGRGLFEGKIIIRLLAGDGTEFTAKPTMSAKPTGRRSDLLSASERVSTVCCRPRCRRLTATTVLSSDSVAASA